MARFGTFFVLILLFAGLTAGCDTTEPTNIRVLVPRDVHSSDYIWTENGVRYFDFAVGDGPEISDTSRIRVHYAAWLSDETLISNSFDSGDPISIDLSAGTVVQGWIEGLPGMREGGERQLVVPPSLAYGDDGVPEAGIPPNSTIIYEIELVEVVEP